MTYNLVALMPMRHSSERIKGKNYRSFGDGRPLFLHVLETLLETEGIDKVVIDTDSPDIKTLLAEKYPSVIVIDRPEHLRDGSTPMNNVLLHDVSVVDSKFYLQTHSTNPLVKRKTFEEAIKRFLAAYPVSDSLFSVTKLQTRLWDQLTRPINHNASILLRTQDLPPVYLENSCMYIFPKETLVNSQVRIGAKPLTFEMNPFEAQDIDKEINFHVAEAIFRILKEEEEGNA